MSGMISNPLEVIGLNRRNIRQFSQNLPAFREFLRKYRRNLALITHTDVSSVSQGFSAEINAAFSEIEAMDEMALKSTVNIFVQDKQDGFGIRLDLRKSIEAQKALTEKLEISQRENERTKEKLAVVSESLKSELDRLFLTLVPKISKGLFLDVTGLYGYVFVNYPIRFCVKGKRRDESQRVERIMTSFYYIHSNGLVYENSIDQKFDKPVSIRHANWSFKAKVEHFVRNFQLGNDWKELGWLIGFSDLRIDFPNNRKIEISNIQKLLTSGEIKRTTVRNILHPAAGRALEGVYLAIVKPVKRGSKIMYQLHYILPASHSPFKPCKR